MKNLTLGKKLKAIRLFKGFTQEGLAIDAGFSIATYGRIERDETDITITDLEKIAKVLSVTVIEILTYNTNFQSEIDKLKKILEGKEKELREKDKEIIMLQKKLLQKDQSKKKS